ncbi:hypothetical protein OG535_00550 [Kitasatospora sp. NBC_00085]|uniref:hypothetical protein n=1 Tax=unclassified Kitasatospora TaxID=2633591 RepID=UPI002F90946B
MEKDQLAHLEQRIHHLITVTKSVTNDGHEELLKIIHRPGWTTPAEMALVTNAVDHLIKQTEALNEARVGLIEGARSIG